MQLARQAVLALAADVGAEEWSEADATHATMFPCFLQVESTCIACIAPPNGPGAPEICW